MKEEEKKMQRWRLVSALAILAVAGLAYAWYVYRFPSWEEEVLLPDGRKIIVKQRRDYIKGYGTRKTWLTFSLPEMGGEQTWAEWLYPSMIGVVDGNVYVVGRPRGDKQFLMYAYPRYVYVAFRWQGGRFVRIPFLSVPEALRRKENVRWCMPGGTDSFVDFSAKPTGTWCSWPPPSQSGIPYFPRPQKVDLGVRMREAEFWAHLSGNQPLSE